MELLVAVGHDLVGAADPLHPGVQQGGQVQVHHPVEADVALVLLLALPTRRQCCSHHLDRPVPALGDLVLQAEQTKYSNVTKQN